MKKHNDKGAAFIELVLVLPILFIMLAAGFEISRVIRFKNAAIQLSYQAANTAFRECSSDKALIMSDCLMRIQRDMTQVAMQISPDTEGTGASHVAITVYFLFDDDDDPETPPNRYQYTARADKSEQEFVDENANPYQAVVLHSKNVRHSANDPIGIQIDNWSKINSTKFKITGRTFSKENPPASVLLNELGQVVVAQAFIKYKPIGFLGGNERLFFDNYVSDYTIM